MAFPATLDIQYYRGDTYEFKLYPKDASGSTFNLRDYTVTFTISTARGSTVAGTTSVAYSAISSDYTNIVCAIKPSNGAWMTNGDSYVYDIQINKSGTDYPSIITLLTGNIYVTEQVTV